MAAAVFCSRSIPSDALDPVSYTHLDVYKRQHINFDEVFQALSDIGYKGRIVSEPFVQMGGEVGRDIKVWRNLDPPDEACLDQEAAYLLKYEQDMLRKYGME